MVKAVFIHPDLGIGGAERLIVDCSLALQVRMAVFRFKFGSDGAERHF